MYVRQTGVKNRLGSFERMPRGRKKYRRFAGFGDAAECARLQSEIATKQSQAAAYMSNPATASMGSKLLTEAAQAQSKLAEACKDVGTKPESSGTSAGEVLTGIAALLNPLAQAGASIFATTEQAKLQKALLKQQSQLPVTSSYMPPQIIQSGPSTGLVVALVGGFAVLALILVMMSKKK